jgi:DnaJ homolog subfamily C member 28
MSSHTKSRRPAPSASEEERLRKARERAQGYRAPDTERDEAGDDQPQSSTPRTLDEWMDVVSNRVEEAMRNGAFDNLPGKGKPLSLERDPFVPEEQQMAYSIMKKNEITPGWIGDRKSVLAAIERLRQEMQETAARFQAKMAQTTVAGDQARLAQEWGVWVVKWEERVKTLNDEILKLNLSQPLQHLEVYKLRLDEELKRAGAARTLSL